VSKKYKKECNNFKRFSPLVMTLSGMKFRKGKVGRIGGRAVRTSWSKSILLNGQSYTKRKKEGILRNILNSCSHSGA
jgi:hypothetical protein